MMMDEPPVPGPDSPALPAPRRRARKGRHPVWGRRLLWMGGTLAFLGTAGAVVVRSAVNRYLKSSAFTTQLTDAASRVLQADCRIDDLSWMDSAAHAGTFAAEGRETADFRRLQV